MSIQTTTNSEILMNYEQQNKNVTNSIKYNNLKQNCDLLKFVYNYQPRRPKKLTGKRCFQDRTAVSEDSPDQFKMFHTLVVDSKTRRFSTHHPKFSNQSFDPNKNYFNIAKQIQKPKKEEQFTKDYKSAIQQISRPFNRKISQYSGLINDNVVTLWGNQYHLMGRQRNSESRRLQNIDRERIIIEKQKTRQQFMKTFHTNVCSQAKQSSKFQLSTSPIREKIKINKTLNKKNIRTDNDLLFSQKTKLRSDRNLIANKLHLDTESYLVKGQYQNLPSYQSSQIFNQNPQAIFRPLTSTISYSKAKISTKMDKLKDILLKYDSNKKDIIQDNDVTRESKKQMEKNIAQWANKTCMSRLYQCSSPTKTLINKNQSKFKAHKLGNQQQKQK